MKVRLPLWSKVLLVAVLNAALLAAASVWFLRKMLSADVGLILLGSARDRLQSLARQVSVDLANTTIGDRTRLLAGYSDRYGMTFHLFTNTGQQVAGPPVTLAAPVLKRVMEGARGPNLGRGGLPPLGQRPPMAQAPVLPPFLVEESAGYWIGTRLALRNNQGVPPEPGTLLLSSHTLYTNAFLFDQGPWLALCAGVMFLALLCWLPLVGGMTRSVDGMKRATAAIAAGRFATRVNPRRADELGQLAHSINSMASQLQDHSQDQKRFLRDAAHELRSPVARMQAALGILERQVGPESLRLLRDLGEEIDLMSALTGDLLAVARSDSMPVQQRLAPVVLADTAARAVGTENAGGAADVRVQVDPELKVTAHPESLFRGISNIVRNAIRYAGDAGPITVTAAAIDGSAVLTVTDCGPGVPEEALDRIFTPFYRVDSSRDRNTGGTGLGMAIARSCIEACNGTIQCRNRNPGLEVAITLELTAAGAAT